MVFSLWSAGIYRWTGGFTGFTTFSYALHEAGPVPHSLPLIRMRDHNDADVDFSRWKGKFLLVDFMYLHCSSVCGILRSRLYDFYPSLEKYMDNNLMLISISFDPERDTAKVLNESLVSLGAPRNWVFASLMGDNRQITESLKYFGAVRYPRGNGDFNHTAMHFLVNPEGNLAAVIDPSQGTEKNLEDIIKIISGSRM